MRIQAAIVLCCLMILSAGCGPKHLSFERTISSELPYGGDLQVALDETRQGTDVVGVSAAVIVDGVGMWTGTSGESYPGHPVSPDTLFDMGSAGKMLAGPLMVKLAEQGLIALDDPIAKYLPDFPYADGEITIRQLLNHTSGLYMMVDSPGGPFRVPFTQVEHSKWWSIDEIFADFGGDPYHAPGTAYCYTQAGYQIATLIVEAVTGSTMAEQVQQQLLDPLDIDGMLLEYSEPLPQDFEIAHPWFDLDGDGTYEDINAFSRNWIASLSRIYYHTRASDFAIYGHALFTGELLEEDSMAMLLDFFRTDDWCGDEAFQVGYAMGVQDFNPAITRGQPAWGHLGSIQGSRAVLAYLHQLSTTLVLMVNTDTDNAWPIADALIEVLLAQQAGDDQEEQQIELSPVYQPPLDAAVVETFQPRMLFCQHSPAWQVRASHQDWIDISLDWVVGTDAAIAEEVWDYHQHTITINGQEIENLDAYIRPVDHYSVTCPAEQLEIWAKGLSIFLPPLPQGEYEIVWLSQVVDEFNNGWVTYKPGNFLEIKVTLVVE